MKAYSAFTNGRLTAADVLPLNRILTSSEGDVMGSDADTFSTILQQLGVTTGAQRDGTSSAFGQFQLPDAFTRFCDALPEANGWPKLPAWRGLISPIGSPSPLDAHNQKLRADDHWPDHFVSFFATDDGDYCFRFKTSEDPTVVYVDHFTTDYSVPAWWTSCDDSNDSFIGWLNEFVDWMHANGYIHSPDHAAEQ